ncbi:tyrosine-type recombinase/integrase [Thauera butanivorans]|uniref:tyrosine-type recombinase/integrase n=1 Tax=Thauera butanivorans TaxID=86174 RepID=UPI00083902E0|nr:Arm DNA-binding domain-containing protein [Thauera butanivorans]
MALTDTALKALKPKDKTYTVTDDRGLYVEVFPTGGVVWRYRYWLNGKYEKLTLGKYPALTLKNARLKRDEAAHQVAMGESPAKKKQQEKVAGAEDATVADFAERFFKDIQSRDRKDVTMPRRYLEKDILPHIGSKPVREWQRMLWRQFGREQAFVLDNVGDEPLFSEFRVRKSCRRLGSWGRCLPNDAVRFEQADQTGILGTKAGDLIAVVRHTVSTRAGSPHPLPTTSATRTTSHARPPAGPNAPVPPAYGSAV